jgi:lipopolysaccharide transport system ATP-binding protein
VTVVARGGLNAESGQKSLVLEPAGDPRSAPLVRVRGLCKRYPMYRSPGHRLAHALFGPMFGAPSDFVALDDVSCDLAPGDALAVVGRNGAGKSTLLQILSGVLEPTSGEVFVPPCTAGLLELGSGFNPEFTGRENIFINAAILGLQRRQIIERLDQIIEFAGIGDFIDQPVKTYSSGMFLRLAFSVAINVEPDLLLVDEALTVGDVFFQQKCYSRLDALRSRGMSVVLVTHSMADAAEFCNRGLVLSQGRVAFTGAGNEAVEYYFHYERETPTGRRRVAEPAAAVQDEPAKGSDEPANEETRWLSQPEVVSLEAVPQFGPDTVRALRMLVADESGRPRRIFRQGEWMKVYVDYEVNEPLSCPLAGLRLINAKSTLVHGKNSLQFDINPPAKVSPGSILRCVQELKLDVDVGEYTLEVGLAELDEALFKQRSRTLPQEIMPQIRLLCQLTSVLEITVVYRAEGWPCLFSHYGVADLPGKQTMEVASAENGQSAFRHHGTTP